MHTFNMKMKTNVQYIANATFAKLPDVIGQLKRRQCIKQTDDNNQKYDTRLPIVNASIT